MQRSRTSRRLEWALACGLTIGWMEAASADGAPVDGAIGPPPTPAELFSRTYYRALSLRPDGARVLSFEVDGVTGTELRVVDHRLTRAAGEAQPPLVLANTALGDVAWARDGRAAFVLRAPPQAEVWIAPDDEPARLALFPDESRGVFELFWRARGGVEELLVLHVVEGPGFRTARLSRADLATRELGETLLDFGSLTIEDAVLSPDGRRLALIATERPRGSPEGEPLDLYVADLATGALRCLSDGSGIASRPAFDADSNQLHCAWWSAPTLLHPGKRDLVRFDLESGLQRNLTRSQPLSLGDGVLGFRERLCVDASGRVVTVTQHGLADHVVVIEPEGRGCEPPTARFVTAGLRSWQWFDLARNGTFVAVESTPGCPERLVSGSSRDWETSLLAEPNAALARRSLARAESIRVAMPEAEACEALWLTPPTPAPWPTLFLLHGGSNGRQTARFNDGYAQAFASAGFAVCAPNLRGSAGYSTIFSDANRGDFGGRELDDLDAVVVALVEQGQVDPSRLYLLGHSYGGFLTELAIAQSSRFAAAAASAGVSDWRRFAATSDLPQLALLGLGGAPAESSRRYEERSPLCQCHAIDTPLLLFHGGRDRRVPLEQSVLLERALRVAGRVCELVIEHDEGHLFRGRAAQTRWIERTIAWFDSHRR